MYQAYAGRILNGKPVLLETVELPENANIVITILDNLPISKPTQQEVAKQVFENLKKIRKDFTEEDKESFARWDNGEYRVNFEDRGLDV